jgi:L-alanine-DL-glutamate epimerase-like enolase superfamily enzyme
MKLHMIKSITVEEQVVDLKEPFITSLRHLHSYPIVQVVIEHESGEIGIGQCVATPQIAGDTHQQILNDLNSELVQGLKEISAEDILELPILPSSRAALDMALWFIGSHAQRAVKTDVTIPISNLYDLRQIVRSRVDAGFQHFKLKVNQGSIKELLQRVDLIREVAGDNTPIRIDPNQAWSLEFAVDASRELEKSGAFIEYLEQPLSRSNLSGHKSLSQEIVIPLMADESCFSARELEGIVESQAFKYLNVKILKSGGIFPALSLIKEAQDAGLNISIGSMMEGEVGIRAAIYLAAETAPDAIHDLDAAWWFKESEIIYAEGTVYS